MKNNKRIFIIKKTEKRLENISGRKLEKTYIRSVNKNNQFKIINKIEDRKLNRYQTSLEFLKLKNKFIQEVISRIVETTYKFYFFKPIFIFYPVFKIQNLFNYIKLRLFLTKEKDKKPHSIINTIQFCNILNKKIQNNKLTNLIYQLLEYEISPPPLFVLVCPKES